MRRFGPTIALPRRFGMRFVHPTSPLRVLGLDDSATMKDVRRAYLTLAKAHHPDCGGDPDTFNRIHEAYEICSERIITGFRPTDHAAPDRPDFRDEDGIEEEMNDPFSGRHRMSADEIRREDEAKWAEFKRKKREETRKSFIKHINAATCPEDLEKLMMEAIDSQCMTDDGEALVLALQRMHLELGYGSIHMERCFECIDKWEFHTKKKAGTPYYQLLLQLYNNRDSQFEHKCCAMEIVEVVSGVMDRMHERGLDHDDYTYLLAKFCLSSVHTNPT